VSAEGLGIGDDNSREKFVFYVHHTVNEFFENVRIHKTLGTTPAVAAGVEFERWTLESVVEMTADYFRCKEDAKFGDAFAKLE
jgi:hypothetical protein